MSEIERLRAELEAARTELLASFEGITADEFARVPKAGSVEPGDRRWSVRDVLWHVGLVEDWIRRTVDQAIGDRTPAPYAHRDRPAIAETPEYLGEWLEQCRRPLLALMRRLPDDALDRVFTLSDGDRRMVRPMLEHVAHHDREHARQIEALRLSDRSTGE